MTRPPIDGDFYIDNATRDFWLHEGGAWVKKGNITPDDDGTAPLLSVAPLLNVGFTLGVQVTRERFLGSIAESYGFSLAAAVDRINALAAVKAYGFSMAVTVGTVTVVQITAALSLGFAMTTQVDRINPPNLGATDAMGFSQASPVTLTSTASGFFATSSGTTPFLQIYNGVTGFLVTLPTTAGQFPTSQVLWVSFNRAGTRLAFCTATKLFIYDMTGANPVFVSSVASPPAWAALKGIAWNSNDTRLVIIDNTVSPFIWVYDTTSWASQTAPTITAGPQAVDWSPSGDRIGVGGDGSTFAFKEFDGSTMAGVTAPATAPTFGVRGVKYSPNGTHLALHGTDARNMFIYNRTGMAICSNASPLPGNASPGQQNLSWALSGSALALVAGGSPCFEVWTRSGDTFTNDVTSATQPAQAGNAICYTRDGTKLLVSVSVANPTHNFLKYDVAGNYTKDTDLAQPSASVICIDSSL